MILCWATFIAILGHMQPASLRLDTLASVHYDLGGFLNVYYILASKYLISTKVTTIQCNTCNYPQTLLYFMYIYDSCGPERLSDFPKVTQLVSGKPILSGFQDSKASALSTIFCCFHLHIKASPITPTPGKTGQIHLQLTGRRNY